MRKWVCYIFFILVLATGLYAFVKIHKYVHFKKIHFTVHKLYLNTFVSTGKIKGIAEWNCRHQKETILSRSFPENKSNELGHWLRGEVESKGNKEFKIDFAGFFL